MIDISKYDKVVRISGCDCSFEIQAKKTISNIGYDYEEQYKFEIMGKDLLKDDSEKCLLNKIEIFNDNGDLIYFRMFPVIALMKSRSLGIEISLRMKNDYVVDYECKEITDDKYNELTRK